MVKHLINPKEFWTAYPIPVISIDSPDYDPMALLERPRVAADQLLRALVRC